MSIRFLFSICLGLSLWGLNLPLGRAAEAASPPNVTAAIQAIQQAADPSAVVAAYADAAALGRESAELHQAYVVRMVELGAPELAYHQAQTLKSLQPNHGLAWGVIAYSDARRGRMPDAAAAIVRAGQLEPGHELVQRTAGEIAAWFDAQSNPPQLPEDVRNDLARLRSSMGQQKAFTTAYEEAKKAYQSQAQASVAPQPVPGAAAPSAASTNQVAPYTPIEPLPAAPTTYYVEPPEVSSYSSTVWVDSSPWWWRPSGFYAGFGYYSGWPVVGFYGRPYCPPLGHYYHHPGTHGRWWNGHHSHKHHHGGGGFYAHGTPGQYQRPHHFTPGSGGHAWQPGTARQNSPAVRPSARPGAAARGAWVNNRPQAQTPAAALANRNPQVQGQVRAPAAVRPVQPQPNSPAVNRAGQPPRPVQRVGPVPQRQQPVGRNPAISFPAQRQASPRLAAPSSTPTAVAPRAVPRPSVAAPALSQQSLQRAMSPPASRPVGGGGFRATGGVGQGGFRAGAAAPAAGFRAGGAARPPAAAAAPRAGGMAPAGGGAGRGHR